MGAASYGIMEVRVVIEPELTHCYVRIEAYGDCPIGVHGWHHKAFPPSVTGVEAYADAVAEGITWPLDVPPCPRNTGAVEALDKLRALVMPRHDHTITGIELHTAIDAIVAGVR